jgi:iron complex outermembrane recepter protein
MSLSANRVGKYQVQPTPLSVDRDCLGFYSKACQENLGLTGKNKFSQRTNWTVADFTFGYNWRYISGLKVELGSGNWFSEFTSIPAYSYVDLSGVWNVSKNARINLSITSVADKKAPSVGNTIGTTTTNNGNTFPQNYDVIGRYFTLGATVRF